jgi:hypothetical protein
MRRTILRIASLAAFLAFHPLSHAEEKSYQQLEIAGTVVKVGQEAYIPQDRLSKFFVRFEGNIMATHDSVYSYKGQTFVITYGPGPSGIYVVKALRVRN